MGTFTSLAEYLKLSASYCAKCTHCDNLRTTATDPNIITECPCFDCILYEDLFPLTGSNLPLNFEPIPAKELGIKYE